MVDLCCNNKVAKVDRWLTGCRGHVVPFPSHANIMTASTESIRGLFRGSSMAGKMSDARRMQFRVLIDKRGKPNFSLIFNKEITLSKYMATSAGPPITRTIFLKQLA